MVSTVMLEPLQFRVEFKGTVIDIYFKNHYIIFSTNYSKT